MDANKVSIIKDVLGYIDEYLEYDVRWNYSGRGMYGRECPAIVTDSLSDLMIALVEGIDQIVEERDLDIPVSEVFRWFAFSQDSMGRGEVVYFPRMRF